MITKKEISIFEERQMIIIGFWLPISRRKILKESRSQAPLSQLFVPIVHLLDANKKLIHVLDPSGQKDVTFFQSSLQVSRVLIDLAEGSPTKLHPSKEWSVKLSGGYHRDDGEFVSWRLLLWLSRITLGQEFARPIEEEGVLSEFIDDVLEKINQISGR